MDNNHKMRAICYIFFISLVFSNWVNASDICCCAMKNSTSEMKQQHNNLQRKANVQLVSAKKSSCCPHHSKVTQDVKPSPQTNHCPDGDCHCQKDLQNQSGIFLQLSNLSTAIINLAIDTYQNTYYLSKLNSIFYPPRRFANI